MGTCRDHFSPTSATSPRAPKRILLVVLTLTLGIPVVAALSLGALGIPHNDAWSHARIAEVFADSGAIVLVGWNRAALLGQVVVLGPLAGSLLAQNLFALLSAGVGLCMTYLFLRRRAAQGPSLLGTVTVAAFPGFSLLATSYMTDMPAFAGVMVALVLADRAVPSYRVSLLAAAVLAGVWAATVREQAVAALIVIFVRIAARWRDHRRVVGLGVILVGGALWLWFEAWRRSLPASDPPDLDSAAIPAGEVLTDAVLLLALAAVPAVLFIARPQEWRQLPWIAASAGGALAAVVVVVHRGDVFLPNYLDMRGAYSAVSIGERQVLPVWWWMVLLVLALTGVSALAGEVAHRRWRIDGTSTGMLAVVSVGTAVQAVLGQTIFDRYLLTLLPFVLAAVLASPGATRWIPALISVGALGATSVVLALNALAFDTARWQAASDLVDSGADPSRIDAGLEWNGYHTAGDYDTSRAPGWCLREAPGSGCYTLTPSSLGDGAPAHRWTYSTFAFFGNDELLAYQR